MIPPTHPLFCYRLGLRSPSSQPRSRRPAAAWLLCLGMLLLLSHSIRASLISNDGFENGLSGWSASQGNGSASFTATTQNPKFGSQCLQVVVNNPGNGSNYPRLTYTPTLAANGNNTYTLSFFARCPNSTLDNRPAKLRIHFDGPNGSSSYDYQPFSCWEEFHFSFKNTSGNQSFYITFEANGTYVLDRILLEDQYEPTLNNLAVIDTPLSYLWQWGTAFRPNPNFYVTGTDNDIAFQLPDGRVAWLFNDSNLGPINYGTNYRGNDTGFVNNALVVQNGSTLDNLRPNADAIPNQTGGRIYWPSDATVDGGKLKVILGEVFRSDGNGTGNSVVASFNLPDLSQASPFLVSVPWAGPILNANDGYLYIYDSGINNQRKVARTPLGSLSDPSQWRFWNGSGWVTDKNAAVVLQGFSDAVVAGFSFERLGTNNYVAISHRLLGADIGVHFANSPVGPWTNYRVIYNTPFEDGPSGQQGISFYYDPYIYKHTGQNGTYSLGYSDYRLDGDPGKRFDKNYYFPQFIKTPNLLALSPYTTSSFSDSFPSNVNEFSNWQVYGGNWAEGFGVFVIDATAAANNGARAIAKGIVLANFTYDVDVKTGAANSDLGAVFRANEQAVGTNAFKGYYAAFKPGTGVVLYRMDGANATQLGSASLSIAANTSYHLKVTGSGSTLKVFVGNSTTAAITVTDGTYGSGGFGLRSYNANGYFDNVSIR